MLDVDQQVFMLNGLTFLLQSTLRLPLYACVCARQVNTCDSITADS